MIEEIGFIIVYFYDFVCSVYECNINWLIWYNLMGMFFFVF